MPEDTNHRAQVDELLADYQRSRAQLASVHRSLSSISETVRSADGAVAATAGARGTLTNLAITDAAYQRYRPAELAELIVQLTGEAGVRAMRTASDVLAPVLPAGTDPEALLLGTADLSPGELRPEPVAETAEQDDDSFEDHEWLQGDDRAPDRRGPA
ncbi:MAG: YbaB/EbfC family DNA-binding protein [Pseudonocardiaceae bacterium]|nr:YbaB/EbfC family DNA-binding protein [Pseudonocardiaceae bacterium]